MITNLKNNIWIEGSNEKDYQVLVGMEIEDSDYKLIYEGKTNDVPENVAKKCVENLSIFTPQYKAYDKPFPNYYENPMMSLESAITNDKGVVSEYCVIFEL